jgi:hypothetical protein
LIPKYFIIFALSLISFIVQGQSTNYPKNYFQKPLDIPLVLSGTFGELRSNHFHSGLDFKTQQKEGFNIFATAAGYVSRIKISNWGYGKAVYITHPNGYTTVYGHLKKFNKKIETYLKKRQYEKESYSIQLFPKPEELPIFKGEIIAFSGSTGGFVGPHLHYEIRKTNGATPINPMLFGLDIADHKKPVINHLYAYPLSADAQVHQSANPVKINFTSGKNGDLIADKVIASGTISFGINTFDKQDAALNRNGIYALDMFVNGKKIYHHDVEKFSFSETRLINLLIDYKKYKTEKRRVQKCFVEPGNTLSIYDRQFPELGYIELVPGQDYQVDIIVKDQKGNQTKLRIPVHGKLNPITIPFVEKKTDYPVLSSAFNKFSKSGVTVAFPKNTFYNDFYLDFKVNQDGSVQVHRDLVPVRKKYTLTFDVSQYSEEDKKHLFIASYNSKNHPSFSNTVKKEKTFYTQTKKLGKFNLLTDIKPPTVKPKNFKDKQWLSKARYLKVAIRDDLSGIKSYRGEIDGKWILLEWDLKKGVLVYDFNDLQLSGSKHQLKIVVNDNANNTKTYQATFYRK